MQIAIDLMGSELPPSALLEGAEAVQQEEGSACSLVGIAEKEVIPTLNASIPLLEAGPSVSMNDSPLLAVRRKRHSSMAVGMRLLREGKIDGFLSTGNTGALIANATFHLPPLPTIARPALLVLIPTARGRVAVLDVGANISFKPSHLVDYARLGSAYRTLADGLETPTIGLLNIGEEDEKGTHLMKETFTLLQKKFPTSFLGNVEGRDVFHGKVDVLVTDAFTGNVFLKTCEGASAFLIDYLESHVESHVAPLFAALHKQFNYAEYPGALLAGVDGLVVKCHGFSNKRALMNGIRGTLDLAQKQIIAKLKNSFL